MGSHAIGHHDFAHDEGAVDASHIGIDGDRFEHTVRATAFRLAGGATVEAPHGELVEGREFIEVFDFGFAAQVRDRSVAIEPHIFEFVFRHNLRVVSYRF